MSIDANMHQTTSAPKLLWFSIYLKANIAVNKFRHQGVNIHSPAQTVVSIEVCKDLGSDFYGLAIHKSQNFFCINPIGWEESKMTKTNTILPKSYLKRLYLCIFPCIFTISWWVHAEYCVVRILDGVMVTFFCGEAWFLSHIYQLQILRIRYWL